MKSFPKVFIVVLNYNGGRFLRECLTSVFKIDYSNFEVVLVDNNSSDGSFEEAKTNFSKAYFIRNEENLGFAAGNNVGIEFALSRGADYVLLLNQDTIVEHDFLSKLVEVGEAEQQIGVLSPIIFKPNGDTWFSGGKIDWLRMKTKHKTKTQKEDYFDSEYIMGCAMLVKSRVFKRVGLIDPIFFLYWEDVDFSLRAKREEISTVMISGSWVYHYEKSEQNKKRKTYWLVLSGLIFFKKNCPWWLKPWIWFYVKLRKIKNRLDLLNPKNELAKTVRKAYADFKTIKI